MDFRFIFVQNFKIRTVTTVMTFAVHCSDSSSLVTEHNASSSRYTRNAQTGSNGFCILGLFDVSAICQQLKLLSKPSEYAAMETQKVSVNMNPYLTNNSSITNLAFESFIVACCYAGHFSNLFL